jgi:hypothetical protein
MINGNNIIPVDFRRQQTEVTVTPKVSEAQQLSSTPARLDDIYGNSELNTTFVATARGRFSVLATSFRAASVSDAIDRDDAISQLKAELPRSFALDGWSDGALAIITGLHHGLRNHQGAALDDAQFSKISEAVIVLRDYPFIRFEKGIDQIEALQAVGFATEPTEAESIQVALHG